MEAVESGRAFVLFVGSCFVPPRTDPGLISCTEWSLDLTLDALAILLSDCSERLCRLLIDAERSCFSAIPAGTFRGVETVESHRALVLFVGSRFVSPRSNPGLILRTAGLLDLTLDALVMLLSDWSDRLEHIECEGLLGLLIIDTVVFSGGM